MKTSTHFLMVPSVLLVCCFLLFATSSPSSSNKVVDNKKTSFRLNNTSGHGSDSTNIKSTLTSTIEGEENVPPHEEEKGGQEELKENNHSVWKDLLIYIFLVPVFLQNVYAFGKFKCANLQKVNARIYNEVLTNVLLSS